ncbi:hypothetical protein F5X97DRAFT_131616 [Nemania serpens]|nr:hypothetical protein F5X97DRAFT_131616 [Nemania serpens]
MCEEVWKRWSCEHLTFATYYACDDWSEAHPGANEEGSEDCENYQPGVIHHTEDMDERCQDCAHLPTPPDSDE